MKMRIAVLGGLVLALGLAGCLLSLTESFEFNVTDETGPLDLAGTNAQSIAIDLSDNGTFADNKDKLKNVDRVGFEATLHTRNDQNAVIDIYFRRDSGDDWMLLLKGAPVAGTTTANAPGQISYEKSEELIQNFETFAQIAEDGIMELRLAAAGGNDEVTISDLLLIVTITAGT